MEKYKQSAENGHEKTENYPEQIKERYKQSAKDEHEKSENYPEQIVGGKKDFENFAQHERHNRIMKREVIYMTKQYISPIEEFRKSRGWSRGALARESGISYVTCNNIENGYTLQISQNILEKLVKVGCPDDVGEQYILWRQSLSADAATPEVEETKEEITTKPLLESQLSETE